VSEAARSIFQAALPLPFVREPVSWSSTLAEAIAGAFLSFPSALEPLAVDALIEDLTCGLVEADPSIRREQRHVSCDRPAVERVRQFLEAERTRIVTSGELEEISGHDRFSLARQFRQLYGTSPYRYLLMRRLDLVRREIRTCKALVDIAVDAGFADQSHMTRFFRATYGLSPAQFRAASQLRLSSAAT
jgi:AraC-like DNA-binding protein